MDLNAIVAAFASKITTAFTDVNMDGYPVSPPNTPCFEVDFPDGGFIFNRTAGNTTNDFQVILRGVVSGDTREGITQLYTWLSDDGVVDVLNADRTLGGTVDDLFVQSASAPLRVGIENQLFFAAEWRILLSVSPS